MNTSGMLSAATLAACLIGPVWGQPIPSAAPAPMPALPPPPGMEAPSPPATDLGNLWKPADPRNYHFFGNVGMNYMWISGGNHFQAGPLMGPSFSAGVLSPQGMGVGVTGSQLNQTTTRTWVEPHKP